MKDLPPELQEAIAKLLVMVKEDLKFGVPPSTLAACILRGYSEACESDA